ncbi:MAG TPA: hypothetical protein VN426_11720 [Syntrophomonadaceae bacterium]|nr:hypothetical protein [Syntrophomonadaceae bacterium]
MEDDLGELQLFLVLNKETAGCGCAPLNYPPAARLAHEAAYGRSD